LLGANNGFGNGDGRLIAHGNSGTPRGRSILPATTAEAIYCSAGRTGNASSNGRFASHEVRARPVPAVLFALIL
jgi:hypothetical protein